jgi:epoxyqueuosine reductase
VCKSASSIWNITKAVLHPKTIKQTLKTEANHLGFVLFGCSLPIVSADYERYEAWLMDGFGEGLPYLARQEASHTRKDPDLLLPGVRTVISLAAPYPLSTSDGLNHKAPSTGYLASYACLEDYHTVLSGLASKLAKQLELLVPGTQTRVCVDTAPVLEKAYAHQAGLGWIGKNTLLFNPVFGSRLLLAEILTTLELPLDQPLVGNPCVDCGLCLEACPTGALLGNHTMDSRRCLSYLTIENRAEIPVRFRQLLGNRVFGCDACQQVCPYNNLPFPATIHLPLSARLSPLVELQTELALNPQGFKAKYAGTPVLRAKHVGFLRNLILAAANSGDPGLIPQLQDLRKRQTDPMLQETLNWAITTLESSCSTF